MKPIRVLTLLTVATALHLFVMPAAIAADKTAPAKATEFWTKRCSPQNGKNYCETFQRLSVQQKGQKFPVRLLEFAVGYPESAKGQARGVLVTPLGISLETPIRVQIGDSANNGFTARPRVCEADGCYALFDLTPAMAASMKANQKMTVTMPSVAGKNVAIIMSLAGFGPALDSIKK